VVYANGTISSSALIGYLYADLEKHLLTTFEEVYDLRQFAQPSSGNYHDEWEEELVKMGIPLDV
jgi:hypothetical protein